MKQYPHKLYVKSTGTATTDENGDFVQSGSVWVEHSDCREELNASKQIVINGEAIVFSSLIYLPKDSEMVDAGAEIKVVGSNEEERASGRVIRCTQERYNCRIWL